MTLILGVDPGSHLTGWAVVDMAPGGKVTHVDNGVVSAGAHALPQRLSHIAQGLAQVIARWRPHLCSVETAYHSKNARSALVLGQARGAAVVTCAQAGLVVFEYGPMQVKLAVTGSGRASKERVQLMVASLMGLKEVAQQDASDALALALTHAYWVSRPQAVVAALPSGPSRRARKGTRTAWTALLKQRGLV